MSCSSVGHHVLPVSVGEGRDLLAGRQQHVEAAFIDLFESHASVHGRVGQCLDLLVSAPGTGEFIDPLESREGAVAIEDHEVVPSEAMRECSDVHDPIVAERPAVVRRRHFQSSAAMMIATAADSEITRSLGPSATVPKTSCRNGT